MKAMKVMGLFLFLGFIALCVLAVFFEWNSDKAYRRDFKGYFLVEYPENNEEREAVLPLVAYILFDMRDQIPDMELQSLNHDLEKALRHFGDSPQSVERYFSVLARRDQLINSSMPMYGHFARACRVAGRIFASSTFRYRPLAGAVAMLHDADCPGYTAHQ